MSKDHHPYGRLSINGKQVQTHQYSFELANGPIPHDLFVCHACDTPRCVKPAHLWLGTVAENTADMIAKGRNRTKLSAESVIQIRAIAQWGNPSREDLSVRFGVSTSAIDAILKFKTWKNSPQIVER